MLPIERLGRDEAKRLKGLLFDLDDTLLDGTRLSEKAYSSLFRLREGGLALVGVTGRPSGWAEVLARQWPVDGMVAENGAVACDVKDGAFRLVDFSAAERARRRVRLAAIVEDLQSRFPWLRVSDDSSARRTDVAFDIGEHERVPPDDVAIVREAASALGARTITSSVHLHVSLDGANKASGAARFLAARFGWDTTESTGRVAFIGDSENDEACFSAFHTTIAVSNFRGRLTVMPRFVTHAAKGAGFAEAAAAILSRRAD
ncbi:MAG TPA: HAD-IIB family hydrolase [Polyangiaceae bacterium]|nr:HAD-IIB family hydrolase [Polyangiaceae bacterium]